MGNEFLLSLKSGVPISAPGRNSRYTLPALIPHRNYTLWGKIAIGNFKNNFRRMTIGRGWEYFKKP
jgi:hypothetical protein